MSKTLRPNYRRGARGTRKAERHIVVRSERRDPPDLRKLSRAVIAMALRDAEAKAEARAAAKHSELFEIDGSEVITRRPETTDD